MSVGNITYPDFADSSLCHPACLRNKFTCRTARWKASERMTAQLTIDALPQARRRRLIGKNPIIHTDYDSQTTSFKNQRLSFTSDFSRMNRKGNCHDNARVETFPPLSKVKLVENGISEIAEDSRPKVSGNIEGYYNWIRLYSLPKYRSPLKSEKTSRIDQWIKKQQKPCARMIRLPRYFMDKIWITLALTPTCIW